jgi:nucleotide-binding universal stress UspA family protein
MAKKNMLVPVDGSSSSQRALEFAADRYRRGDYEDLIVLNVQPTLPPSRFVTRSMIAEYTERQSEEALQPARKAAKRHGVKPRFHVEKGDPAEEIVRFARRHGCEEIIIGTRGQGRVKGMLMGSVALKVVHLSNVPVTLVK